MNRDIVKQGKYIVYDLDRAKVVFSTAEEELNFNKASEEGLKNLRNLKSEFNVSELCYLNQIHSVNVLEASQEVLDGDAMISIERNKIVGVFTADCVPVILYDEKRDVIAAIHSGWKGTIRDIVTETINVMEKKYSTEGKDIKAFVGPHIGKCCYEVSEELLENFSTKDQFKELNLKNSERKLDMQSCIVKQLSKNGIIRDNITLLNICTSCDRDFNMHSYRKKGKEAGRMFSFIYLK